jgi:DNA-binding NarL/FixJ family response regulator
MGPNPDRIRIIIAEDHKLVAEALQLVLEDCFDVVDIVGDGRALITAVARLRPDVVVTDLVMPRMDGLEAIRVIRSFADPPAIVVLSMHGEGRVMAEAQEAGVSGYVLKESAGADLHAAVVAVHAGGTHWPPQLRTMLTSSGGTATQGSGRTIALTPRQSQVLELTARGFGMKQIGEVLHISARTVETHKYQMMEALSARTTAELVQHAVRRGLLDVTVVERASRLERPSRRSVARPARRALQQA